MLLDDIESTYYGISIRIKAILGSTVFWRFREGGNDMNTFTGS